jgi:hypothetical protein
LNSQPENTLRHCGWARGAGGSSTRTRTNAPTSSGRSHGAVRSQLSTVTTTLPTIRRSPTFSTRSCVRLLRLFSRPIVAIRSLFGVTPPLSAGPVRVVDDTAVAFAAGGCLVAG